jgi:hypothetical protein
MLQRPRAISLNVCEQVIVEEHTRNITLVNCFQRLYVREFPSAPQRLAVHAVLTDGHGTGNVRLAIVRLETLEDVYVRDVQVTFSNPLREFRLLFRPPSLSFSAAGRYEISLLVDEDSLTRRVIQIVAAG